MAQGELEEAAIAQVRSAFVEPMHWSVLPLGRKTVDMRHLAFVSFSRTLCVFHDQMVKNKHYPFRIFLLLVDPALEATIIAERCQWDEWTVGFATAYKNKGGITCPDAMEDLRATACTLKVDMAQIEALHASLRRVVVTSGCQPHAFPFADGSADMVLRKFRRQREHLGERLKDLFATGGEPADRSSDTPAGSSGGLVGQPRGGGGPWRAFIADYMDNHPNGSPDFEALAHLYNSLSDDEKERYKRLGAMGARKHREGDSRPFGDRKREVERGRRKALLQHAGQAMLDASDLGVEDVAALSSGLAEALAVPSGNVGSSLVSAVAVARSRCAIASKVRVARERAEDDFLATAGADEQRGFADAFRPLEQKIVDLQPAPQVDAQSGGAHHRLEWRPAGALREAALLAGVAGTSKLGRLASRRLEDAWAQLHKKVPASPSPHLEGRPPKRPACLAARMCVCQKSGRAHIAQMATGLSKACRAILRHQPCAQDLLGGRVCAAFVGRTREQAASDQGGRLPMEGGGHTSALWHHIGHLALKPWKPLFHEMVAESVPDDGSLRGPVRLKGTCTPKSCCEALSSLDKGLKWDVMFFRLARSSRLLSELDTLVVEVEPIDMPGVMYLHPVWDPFKGRRGKKRKVS